MTMTIKDVREGYGLLREVAYRRAEKRFAFLGVRLREMTQEDAEKADKWPDLHGVRTWSWVSVRQMMRRKPKRFEVSVSVGDHLCALCMGEPTHGKLALKIYVLEGSQVGNPLRGQVLPVLLYTAHIYAAALGSIEVRICNPVNDKAVALYEKYGYSPVENNRGTITHMVKET